MGSLGDRFINRLHDWTAGKKRESLLRDFGGIQWCPWCLQCVQSKNGWLIQDWARDPMLDVITCGPCGGTSLWRFEMGMVYVGPLDAPKAKHQPMDRYDIEAAKLNG